MTTTLWILIAAFALADLIILPPMIARAKRLPMDDKARADAPGQFADLSFGKTHYQWHGSNTGDIVVLVHGLSAPSFVFAALIPFLTSAGFRVLTYDLYGRGWSDRPRDRQSGAFFARQLTELLDHQNVRRPVTLLGYSMGGAIVASFAVLHPDRVRNLILLASAGFAHQTGGMVGFIRHTPLLGDWLMAVLGGARLRVWAKREVSRNQHIPDIADRMAQETRYRGYTRSILSSLRNLLARPFDGLHQALAAKAIPTLAIWGGMDETIPIASADRLTAANPAVKTVILDRADHALAYTMPRQVAEPVLTFLTENGA